ncbi:MAG: signal peptidase II [Pseudomonadota bacterium]|nr:signal peptidase II [Pseudomonadota bacterium]
MQKVKNYFSLRYLGIMFALLWISLDQATKGMALKYLTADPVPVIDGFFNLRLAFNRGVSFSLLRDVNIADLPEILGIFAFVVAVVLVHYLGHHKEKLVYILGLSFILGGAVGNGIDRFAYGAVVDFLDFHYAGWHWPTFNVADIAIVLGVMLMLYDAYFESNDTTEMEIEKGEDEK